MSGYITSIADVAAVSLMLAVYLLIALWVSGARVPRLLKQLVYVGLAVRIAGAWVRMMWGADSIVYYRIGREYAEYFREWDFTPLVDPSMWRAGSWTGTAFVDFVSGFVVTFLGSSFYGTFLAFALLALAGLAAYAVAFRRALPRANYVRYWGWLLLLPSLWFWPSSIGKEAIMTLGLGVATLGFVGNGKRINWMLLATGLFFVWGVRPQVVAVFLFAMIMAYWLNFQEWNLSRMVQGVVMLALGLVGIWFAMANSAGGADVEAIEAYMESNLDKNRGGSGLEGVPVGPAGVPIAIMNVLFRPFLWEAHNAIALVAALELALMWGLIWMRRRQLVQALRIWRQYRILRFAVPFVLLYTVALGMNLANLGIIARQRTLMYPLLFLILVAGTMPVKRNVPRRPPGPRGPRARPRSRRRPVPPRVPA